MICIYTVCFLYCVAQKSREKIYVLDQGNPLLLALSQDVSQNRPVEARDNVKHFYELFLILSIDYN